MRGLTRSVVFESDGEGLVSGGYELCSFVPMQGVGTPVERVIPLAGDEVSLRIDGDQQVDADRLGMALSQPRMEEWSGVTVSGVGRFDGLHLWLAINLPKFGVLTAQKQAAASSLVAHAWALGMPTAMSEDSFAYLGLRGVTPGRMTCEFGVYGHGPGAKELTDQVLKHIRSWDGSNLDARIEMYPAGTPDGRLPEGSFVLDKKHRRVIISWPARAPRPSAQTRNHN